MIKKLRIITAGLSIALVANIAQGAVTYPYTDAIKYPFGFQSSKFTDATFQEWYTQYKSSKLIADCNGGKRTTCVGEDGEATTKVESMGWAAIIAAYMGDKTTYDGLIKFYKSKLQSHGMMDWKTGCNGDVDDDKGSASDGDLDVAFGAVVAAWQWGGSYVNDAKAIINTCKKLIVSCNGTSVLAAGMGSGGNSPYGGCSETDLSYYTPAFFREFAKFTGDNAWSKLADDTYYILEKTANQSTGLVPDWHTYNGQPYSGSRNGKTYHYDACRVPWRMAIDYLWNGNERALAWCKKVTDWANKVGASNIKDGYSPDGNPTGSYNNQAFVGAFATAAMCNTQTISDAFADQMAKLKTNTGYWYHGFLGTIYTLTMTGHMWTPDLLAKQTGVQLKTTSATASAMVVTNVSNRTLNISGMKNVSNIDLTSMNGQIVKQTENISNGTATMDVSSVKRGCYLLSIRGTDGKVSTTQVVLMK
ncbi:MAG: T9SS type A sorting domain-containing protein [Fibrobacter sp.]|nr:T9SS type A sorting domain-containing protein [Fibrobacter sp.]